MALPDAGRRTCQSSDDGLDEARATVETRVSDLQIGEVTEIGTSRFIGLRGELIGLVEAQGVDRDGCRAGEVENRYLSGGDRGLEHGLVAHADHGGVHEDFGDGSWGCGDAAGEGAVEDDQGAGA